MSRAFALGVFAIAAFLAWWAWYELIRSPYLTHGFMTLDLQFRLPPGMQTPSDPTDVHVDLEEGGRHAEVLPGAVRFGHAGDRRAIVAHTTLSLKTRRRIAHLELPGLPEQTWSIDLPGDPDPTPGFSGWRAPTTGASGIEMNYRLSAEH